MTDVLADALRAEGLDDDAIGRVDSYLSDHDHYVAENWMVRERREKEAYKAADDARKAATLAKAIPYTGRINDCQAQVWTQGRGGTAHRCQKLAKFVVRRTEYGKDSGDGRLAVCRIHASDPSSHRYTKHWSHEVSAAEIVEPEYQPAEGEKP